MGIADAATLDAVGAVEAYARVCAAHPRATTEVLLWALFGALVDLDWREVPAAEKARLRAELRDRDAAA